MSSKIQLIDNSLSVKTEAILPKSSAVDRRDKEFNEVMSNVSQDKRQNKTDDSHDVNKLETDQKENKNFHSGGYQVGYFNLDEKQQDIMVLDLEEIKADTLDIPIDSMSEIESFEDLSEVTLIDHSISSDNIVIQQKIDDLTHDHSQEFLGVEDPRVNNLKVQNLTLSKASNAEEDVNLNIAKNKLKNIVDLDPAVKIVSDDTTKPEIIQTLAPVLLAAKQTEKVVDIDSIPGEQDRELSHSSWKDLEIDQALEENEINLSENIDMKPTTMKINPEIVAKQSLVTEMQFINSIEQTLIKQDVPNLDIRLENSELINNETNVDTAFSEILENVSFPQVVTQGSEKLSISFKEVPSQYTRDIPLESEQIIMAVKTGIKDSRSQITLTMYPETLGTVDIKIEFSKIGEVQAIKFFAEKSDTLRLLLNDYAILERSLNEVIKADNASLSFNLRDGQNGQNNPEYENSPVAKQEMPLLDSEDQITTTRYTLRNILKDDSVDIKV